MLSGYAIHQAILVKSVYGWVVGIAEMKFSDQGHEILPSEPLWAPKCPKEPTSGGQVRESISKVAYLVTGRPKPTQNTFFCPDVYKRPTRWNRD